jgi:3-hydroxyisobutyrate dehydrogenase
MNIGWVGTGVMGASMAGHLLRAGSQVTVYSRTKAKAAALLGQGAVWADTPRAVAEASEVCFTMVGYPRDVEEIYLGPEGILSGATSGTVAVDCTTSSPSLARRLAQTGAERGIGVLDAPVSGGDVGARNATLSFMVGGDEAVFGRVKPLLAHMGKTIVLQGAAGSGQHTKMVNQILIAGTMIGMTEGLLYARSAGLDPETVLQSVGGGAAASWSLQNLLPRILKGDLEPGFFVEHFIKDMGIALAEAESMNLALPGLALAKQLYQALLGCGGARKGTHALIVALESLSGRRTVSATADVRSARL